MSASGVLQQSITATTAQEENEKIQVTRLDKKQGVEKEDNEKASKEMSVDEPPDQAIMEENTENEK